MKKLIIILFLLISGCSENPTQQSLNVPQEKVTNDNSGGVYRVYVNLKPQESLHLTGEDVGFFGWWGLNINSDNEIELRANQQETILQFTDLYLQGIRWENITIINNSHEVANINIEIFQR